MQYVHITTNKVNCLSHLYQYLMGDEIGSHLLLSTLSNKMNNLSSCKKSCDTESFFFFPLDSEPNFAGLITHEKRAHIVSFGEGSQRTEFFEQLILKYGDRLLPSSLFAEESIADNFIKTLKKFTNVNVEKNRNELLCSAVSSKTIRLSNGKLERAEVKDKVFVSAALAGYKRELFPQSQTHETPESIEENIISNNLYIWRINEPVAFAEITRETPNTCSITSVYTFPEYRNRGYAKSLVKAIMDLVLFQKNYCLLFSNKQLFQELYRPLGFTIAQRFVNFDFVYSLDKEVIR